ncbi:MAG: hypothetical protein Q4Q53_08750 [Methanocorpusculum sp.]|nr:hypothetical protein [Methanocorpusculum sp.]
MTSLKNQKSVEELDLSDFAQPIELKEWDKAVGTLELPKVYSVCSNFADTLKNVNIALFRYNGNRPTVFFKDGILVEAVENEKGDYGICKIKRSRLRTILYKAGSWVKEGTTDSAKLDNDLLDSVLTSLPKEFPSVRALKGLYSSAILTRDGRIFSEKGYESESGYYITKTCKIAEVPAVPSKEDLEKARGYFSNIFGEFAFENPVDFENAVLSVCSMVKRASMDSVFPIWAVDKNTTRAGATLLMQTAGAMAYGKIPGLYASSKRENEIEKLIASAVKFGEPLVIIDNVTKGTNWTPENLLSATSGTGEVVSRNMGTMDVFTTKVKAMFAVNGVNLDIRADVCGRVYKTRLVTKKQWQDSSFKRSKQELFDLAVSSNSDIVWATAVFQNNWAMLGKPKMRCDGNLSEYPEWFSECASMVYYAGYSSVLSNQKELQTSDNDAETFGAEFVNCLYDKFKLGEFTPLAVMKAISVEAENRKVSNSFSANDLLNYAPENVMKAAVSSTLTPEKIGRWIKEYMDCKFVDCDYFVKREKSRDGIKYRLAPVELQSNL